MSDAVRYLVSPHGSFWAWDEGGNSLSWDGGRTIAFRAEVSAVLRRLADVGDGLPPFAAVVLLLAATRENWVQTGPQLVAHANRLADAGGQTGSAAGVTLRAIGHRLAADTAAVVARLDAVAALPHDLRQSPAAKAVLAEVIFERAARSPHPPAAAVLAELDAGTDPTTFDGNRTNLALRELVDVLDALRPGLTNLDPDQLATRLRTGLDGLVRPADADLGPTDRARLLLAQPSDDPDLSAVTKLARGLLAAVSVPRPVGTPDDRPAGGVADLSNRGPLDRLLLSELAHDDLTLAVRVAVNEALYLQRETPPREPPRRRTILIDTGLRTWGVPRLFAAAVALALTATADPAGDVTAYRPAAGPDLAPADLTTRAGLLAHLAAVDGRAHVGQCLPAFAAVAETGTEPFLVIHADALDDDEFRRSLLEHGPASLYAAAVDRDGSFHLWHLSPAGRRLVRSARLDLNAIFDPPAKPSRRPPIPLVAPADDLPLICSVRPFPLRLPLTSPVLQTAGKLPYHFVGVTADRRLLSHDPQSRSAVVLSDELPAGRLALLWEGDYDHVTAVFVGCPSANGKPTACVRAVYFTFEGRAVITPLAVDFTPAAVVARGGLLYLMGRSAAAVFDLTSPEPLADVSTAGYRRVRGRIFANETGCYLLAWDGSRAMFQPLPVDAAQSARVFEPSGQTSSDGPLFVGRDGEVTPAGLPDRKLVAGLGKRVSLLAISDDDNRLIGRSSGPETLFRLDLNNAGCWTDELAGSETGLLDWMRCWLPQSSPPPAEWSAIPLRTRLDAVFVDAAGLLTLVAGAALLDVGRPGRPLRLYDRGGTHFVGTAKDARVRPFGRPAKPPRVGYTLRTATWSDGSRAVLDSRGLLHLISADRSLPQVAIVLVTDGPLAGWSSDGRVYGTLYFHGRDTSHDPSTLYDLIRRFTGPLR